ncbi:hypothetical protein D5S17_13855 [Pseudonocardiaceae bacterium YIM PH 21723]|nr:hypothetical protein D5S17_13855 [Pseudonocardiaceae bacterium YIM PH 21723]
MGESVVYQVHRGFSAVIATQLLICVAGVLIAVLIKLPYWLTGLVALCFGGAALYVAIPASRGEPMLRVDAHGVTFGAPELRVSWADIEQIVLYSRSLGTAELHYIGLRGHVTRDELLASRAMNDWRVDRERLVEATAEFAPDVPVVELKGLVVTDQQV